jgi:hypothetical protein
VTLERASEIVFALDDPRKKRELFTHFVDHFGLGMPRIETFAQMCGYAIAKDIRLEEGGGES